MWIIMRLPAALLLSMLVQSSNSAKNATNSETDITDEYVAFDPKTLFLSGKGTCSNASNGAIPCPRDCGGPGLWAIPPILEDADAPQYELRPPKYMKTMSKEDTIHSDFNVCSHDPIIRTIFGNPMLPRRAHSVPIHWSEFLSVRRTVMPKVMIETLTADNFWPEVIIPFLFPLTVIVMGLVCIVPYLIIGGLCWAVVFQLRFLGHKRIRMIIRGLLIRLEKFRRWKYERSFPSQHLRKFRERDRYQMPRAFQDSDLSSDDEPVELTREQIPRQKMTMWTDEEIDMLGFDPDNIPMEWVYGDLLGNPGALAPEVKAYISRKQGTVKKPDVDEVSLNSDEWADFLRNRVTEKMQREKEMFLTSLKDTVKSGVPTGQGSNIDFKGPGGGLDLANGADLGEENHEK